MDQVAGRGRERTEQLLSPQSRRDWGRTGISKAESKEEGTGGGSREPRMKRAGNQDIRAISEEARYQMKDENPVLCGITVFDQSSPNGITCGRRRQQWPTSSERVGGFYLATVHMRS